MASKKHYWKKNEIIYLGQCVESHTGIVWVHWDAATKDFNEKYSYDLSTTEIMDAYNRYYGKKK